MSKFTRDPEIEISGSAAGTMASATGAYLDSSVKRKNETEVQPVV